MHVTRFAAALTVISVVPACGGDGGQGLDDWGDIGGQPSGSTTTQTIPAADAGAGADAPVSADAALDLAGPVDLTATATPDLLVLPVDLAPPVDLRPPEPDAAPPERCARAAFVAAKNRHDNLLAADFATNAALAGWTSEFGAAQSWDSRDASAAATSGALAVTNANVVLTNALTSLAGTRTCVRIAEGAQYDLWAQEMIAPGQPNGRAGFAALYFAATDCTGMPVGAETVGLSGMTGDWTLQCGTATAPGPAHSMALRLVVAKPFDDPALTVLFDDVVVSPHP